MKMPRFNNDRRLDMAWRRFPRKHRHPKWTRMSHIGGRVSRDLTDAGRRRIFAVVAPCESAAGGGKGIRRILIFDNHPDSLRLVLDSSSNSVADLRSRKVRIAPQVGLTSPKDADRTSFILGLMLLIPALALAILWWLL
jgi:hypothetical protein